MVANDPVLYLISYPSEDRFKFVYRNKIVFQKSYKAYSWTDIFFEE